MKSKEMKEVMKDINATLQELIVRVEKLEERVEGLMQHREFREGSQKKLARNR